MVHFCVLSTRSSVTLTIRKVQFAPESEGVAPSVETTKDFVMSEKPLHVKASLDKEVMSLPVLAAEVLAQI